MRILFVVNELAYFRAHRENLATGLMAQGHEVLVAAGKADDIALDNWPDALKLIPLPVNLHHLDIPSDIRLIRTIARTIADERPDVVHGFTIKPVLFGGLAISLLVPKSVRSNLRVVWTFPGVGKIFEHGAGVFHRFRRFLVATALKFAFGRTQASATFENAADRSFFVEQGIVPAENAHVTMGTGLDRSTYRQQSDQRHESFDGETPLVFLMSSRLIGEKGVDTYLTVARASKALGSNAVFQLAGLPAPGNPDALAESVLVEAQESGAIEYLGAIAQSEMPELLNQADVVVLPTRLREGFPRSLLEAAACGCAMIASDQPPMRTLVVEGETGWLIDPPDSAHLQDAFDQALTDPNATRRKGKAAAELIQQLPVGDDDVRNQFLAIYRGSQNGPG